MHFLLLPLMTNMLRERWGTLETLVRHLTLLHILYRQILT